MASHQSSYVDPAMRERERSGMMKAGPDSTIASIDSRQRRGSKGERERGREREREKDRNRFQHRQSQAERQKEKEMLLAKKIE